MRFSRFALAIALVLLNLPHEGLIAQEIKEGISWNFDESTGSTIHDTLGNRDDQITGFWARVPGVSGEGLQFDGFSTSIVRKAGAVPKLGDEFSVAAWVAVDNYPWNWVPIADQSADNQVGFFFGIDAFGHIGFNASVDGIWQHLTTKYRLPLKKWTRIAASFNSQSGMIIYVNGTEEAALSLQGHFQQANDADLYVGRVRTPLLPFPSWLSHPQDPFKYSFDGYLDEFAIQRHALSTEEAAATFAAAGVTDKDVIPYAPLPSGPSWPGPFGAFYASLRFKPSWDRPRRLGPDSDVVVRFDNSPMRLVFWQGTNFVPAWVTSNGKWYTDEFLEAWGPQCVDGGDCEPMSDKQSRYSRVSILESSPARAVLHWRYALSETRNYKGANTDPETGWFDWADEYWYVYPDGVAVRKQVLWSSDLDPQPPAGHEWQETIVINGPGQRPEDNIESDALTLMNLAGETHTYHWNPKTDESFEYPHGPSVIADPDDANIQIVNLRSTEKPFQIVFPKGVHFDTYNGERSYSMFEWWNHWPVAQIPSSGRPALAPDRASHTSLSHIYWAAYEKTDQTETKLLLSGLTTQSPKQLLPLAKSWISPPAVLQVSGDSTGTDFDPAQRAFVIHRTRESVPGTIHFTVKASNSSPLLNPAFVIEHWQTNARVIIHGQGKTISPKIYAGHSEHLEGNDLILFVLLNSTSDTEFEILPQVN